MTAQQMMLAYYESMRELSHRMLEATRHGRWDDVAEGEREAAVLAEKLRAIGDPGACLDAAGRKRRFEILQDVLADDAEMRNVAHPWLRAFDVTLEIGRAKPRLARPQRRP